MTARILIATMILVLAPGLATAQANRLSSDVLRDGSRVRVTTTDRLQFSGRVISSSRDSLVVARDSSDAVFALPPSAVARVELSRGFHTSKGRDGVLWGLGGALIGGAAGSISYQKPERTCKQGDFFCLDLSGLDRMAAALTGAAVGGAIGGLFGVYLGSHAQEEWLLLRDTPTHLAIVPSWPAGVRVTASLAF